MRSRILIAGFGLLAATLVAPPPTAHAAVLCASSSGVVRVRVNCHQSESQLDPDALGLRGSQGEPGAQGPQGDPGPQGGQGVQGAMGPQGLGGPAGSTGATGQTGPQGAPGGSGSTPSFDNLVKIGGGTHPIGTACTVGDLPPYRESSLLYAVPVGARLIVLGFTGELPIMAGNQELTGYQYFPYYYNGWAPIQPFASHFPGGFPIEAGEEIRGAFGGSGNCVSGATRWAIVMPTIVGYLIPDTQP